MVALNVLYRTNTAAIEEERTSMLPGLLGYQDISCCYILVWVGVNEDRNECKSHEGA